MRRFLEIVLFVFGVSLGGLTPNSACQPPEYCNWKLPTEALYTITECPSIPGAVGGTVEISGEQLIIRYDEGEFSIESVYQLSW